MFEFNTVEEALEDLKNGKIILVTDDEDREMRGILYVLRSLQQQKILILWQHMEKVLYVCLWLKNFAESL